MKNICLYEFDIDFEISGNKNNCLYNKRYFG